MGDLVVGGATGGREGGREGGITRAALTNNKTAERSRN